MATTREAEGELLELERRYWQAIKDHDVDAALRLTDDPCIVTGPQGVAWIDHREFEGVMRSEPWRLRSFEVDEGDVQVRFLRDDVAVVAYKIRERRVLGDEEFDLEAADSSTWVRRADGWRCALHTEALTGDPFGRDRRTR
jgi:hypothetical protein